MSQAPATRELPPFTSCLRAFEEEFDYLHRAVQRLGVTGSDAEDLVQDVFVVMWRRWSDYQPDRPLRAWMVGIAAHLAHRHKRRRLREVVGALLDTPDERPLAEERLASASARNLVLRVLGELPPKHRIPLVMHEIEGLSMAEITDILGIPLATAYTRVRRARLAFAAALDKLQIASTDAPLSPAAVLAAEKPASPAPAGARGKALSRARALLAGPPPAPAAGPAWPLPVAAAAGAAALVAVATVLVVGAGPRRTKAVPAAALSGLQHGLVGHWRFDESAPLRDLSRTGNDCRIRGNYDGRGFIQGPAGAALVLWGGRALECDRPAVSLGTGMSASAWIRPLQLRRYHGALVSQQLGDDWDHHYLFAVDREDLVLASDAWNIRLRHPLRITGDWVHVAFTRAPDGRVRLYIAGRPVVEAISRQAPPDGRTGRVMVGGTRVDPQGEHIRQQYYGALDELMLFDRPLDEIEIAALAAAGT